MNLKNLSDQELIKEFSDGVLLERKHASEIIDLIREIHSRKLYLKFQCTSLFQYLTEKFGYTPGSAQRRIDAARLLKEIPSIKDEIREGELNLMQISTLARSVREKQKTTEVLPHQKREILTAIKNQDLPSSEATICAMLDLKPKMQKKRRTQKDESVRLELTLSKEQMAVIEEAKAALSHQHPCISMADLFFEIAKIALAKKGLTSPTDAKLAVRSIDDKMAARPSSNKAYVPRVVRRQVFQEEKCCQWRDKASGKICGSKFQLQIDHRQSLWAEGTSARENLQLLCAVHNRMKYRREAGLEP